MSATASPPVRRIINVDPPLSPTDPPDSPYVAPRPGPPLLRPDKEEEDALEVKPASFLSNERTFLSWCSFAVTLGGLAIGLLNFGNASGRAAGVVFSLLTILTLFYSLFLFFSRAISLRRQIRGTYEARVGPTVIVLAMVGGVIINALLIIAERLGGT
ncbi:hypothetical protein DFJ74DRAFT_706304 [Hyaloraphidium curvatum]|nr:hypothetical protein DFJ74DRAFT_706304 [Hyaloraphidium curvatum]